MKTKKDSIMYHARTNEPLPRPLYVPAQLVVKFKSSGPAVRQLMRSVIEPEGAKSAELPKTPAMQLLSSHRIKNVMPLFAEEPTIALRSFSERVVSSLRIEGKQAGGTAELRGINLVEVESSSDVPLILDALQRDENIEYAHPIAIRYPMMAAPRRRTRRAASINDPLYHRQWGHVAVRLPQAHQSKKFFEATDITVAVVDSGVDATHPDLEDMIFEYTNFISNEDDRDRQGHGTHVAGIISAKRNNALGVSGVCQCKLLCLKALGATWDAVAYYRALQHAAERAQVINLSLGGGKDQTETLLIQRALKAGVTVVAAMGNEYEEGNPTSYPAAIPGVISVGASDEADRRARFSNTGRHIDLVAPGVNILSTVPTYPSLLAERTDYDSWPGTSMATPYVAACVALLLAKKNNLTPAKITRLLQTSADKTPYQAGKWNHEYGHGRLNIERALAKA
ncbi:MAG: S8 family serine peptidase [candidate division KSB1 bacterium]|nr:S8 family serine peptidase [candidate division KSB1 bacterium]